MGSRWLIDKQKPEHSHICMYSFTLTSIVPLFPPIATVFPKPSSSTSRKALIAISLISWFRRVLLISDHGSQLFKGNSSNGSHPTCCKNTISENDDSSISLDILAFYIHLYEAPPPCLSIFSGCQYILPGKWKQGMWSIAITGHFLNIRMSVFQKCIINSLFISAYSFLGSDLSRYRIQTSILGVCYYLYILVKSKCSAIKFYIHIFFLFCTFW